jgi:hypothetical protein
VEKDFAALGARPPLNLPASQVLMVGDRAAYDGAAAGEGMVTLLLPALRSKTDCRLHLVTVLLG